MKNEFEIEITSQAYLDLKEIFDWYSLQKEGLEKEFSLSFEAALNRIERNPLGYQIVYNSARSIFLQRFPYKIFYKTYGKTIKIYYTLHHSRNPKLIRKRIK